MRWKHAGRSASFVQLYATVVETGKGADMVIVDPAMIMLLRKTKAMYHKFEHEEAAETE
jgi:hypothetical protein